jgi:ATP adenylyltransferase
MNLGRIAGAGVPDHLHWHVVPRWSADTSFMPVVGETIVLPELVAETAQRLGPRFAE